MNKIQFTPPLNMSLNIKKIPVFVFPNALKFHVGSKTSHKQLLSLYNPYDFPVRFKVLCTSPKKYVVIDPEGSIGPQMMVDIIVRHTSPLPTNCNITDKFRITMQDHATKQVLGTREIEATLLQGDDTISNDGDFQNFPFSGRGISEEQRLFLTNRPMSATQSRSYVISIITGVVCVVLLMLPTQQEVLQTSSVSPYLHLSVHVKLAIAYVLGLVSTVIFRP